METRLEKILKKFPFLGRTSEKDTLLDEVKNKLGGGAVYGCLYAISVYKKAKEAGEDWTRAYSTEIDFLRDLVAKATTQ